MTSKTTLLLPLDIDHISDKALKIVAGERYINSDILDKIARTHYKRIEIMEILIMNPGIKTETILFLYQIPSRNLKEIISRYREDIILAFGELVPTTSKVDTLSVLEEEDEPHIKELSLFQRIQRMPVAERLHFALKTDRDGRNILIRDSNKQVALAVLDNPKITGDEIIIIAQSRNVQEEIIREVCKNREWTKNYSVISALVNNPKTPIALSLNYLTRLKEKDLALLCKNKGISRAIRDTANRIIQTKKSKN